MGERLVVVSNRVAGDRPPAGGLVFALHDCLTQMGGIWVGSGADLVEAPAPALRHAPADGYDRYLLDLTEDEQAQFYLGYSNSVLWPLCHGRTDLMQIKRGQYAGYRAVNARMADQMLDVLDPDDLIWIHDYHFLPLAEELRRRGVTNRIGFFLHIPFPAGHDIGALSQSDALMEWLGAYDLIGLQSERDVAQFIGTSRQHPGTEILMDGRVRMGNRLVAVRACPIGIDVAAFQGEIGTGEAVTLSKGEKLIVGVDRLDYSKGLPQRFDAMEHFLDTRTDADPTATFLQVAPISRGEVAAYQDIRQTLEQKAGAINGAHGTPNWMPIRYISQSMDRAELAGVFRQSAVGLVTPLIDGMNLVAKEYVAAQDPDDPGVLVLSRLAGAAEQMTDALQVNPYDPTDMGEAIRTALAMPLDERKARHARLLTGAVHEDIHWWTRTYLDQLRQVRAVPVFPLSA
ncbi:trehalose-6-phosphate synthase [uncultured Tateyamaria sp.]|uniref:alpha,alpha-trehalose-phosphate synthase (UDP-forming) n=1 Tax=uncultured Tateyamaria sp. TaxID=455651 RepID=UPI00262E7896|nr:trehalose-6-phosphate synthase [uncultured Tateyamaria sp.]